MEENLQILKEIGAQKIHKDTHISREYVQALIHGSYDGLNAVQFNGFISILEREYSVDLSELKRKGKEHFGGEDSASESSKKVFVTPQKQKNNSPMYIWAGIILFAAVLYYSFVYLSSMANVDQTIDNTQIEDAQKIAIILEEPKKIEASMTVEESNSTQDTQETQTIEVVLEENVSEESVEAVKIEVKKEIIEEIKTLKILPKSKIWAGYINIKTNQKYQKIFRKEFTLDVTKDWLLLFGSGTVHLEVNTKKQTFSSKQNMRFKYVDGEFEKITVTEFKSLNKGRKW